MTTDGCMSLITWDGAAVFFHHLATKMVVYNRSYGPLMISFVPMNCYMCVCARMRHTCACVWDMAVRFLMQTVDTCCIEIIL